MLGFGISILALTLAQKSASERLTYGWHRAEIIGTLVSVSSSWIMTGWLLVEATKRFFSPPQVKGDIMLIVAVMGLIFNLIQMKILHSGDGHYHLGGEHEHDHDHGHHHHEHNHAHDHGHSHGHDHGAAKSKIKDEEVKKPLVANEEGHQAEHQHHHHDHGHNHNHDHHHDHNHGGEESNINVDAAYLHVLGDMLMSVGVIIAATIIYFFPSLWMADPLCTYLFSFIVLFTTIPIIKNIIGVMMEGTPERIDVEQLREDIYTECGNDIVNVHDLHVWTISVGKISMTGHIQSIKPLKTLAQVTDLLRRKYNLHHTTI
jgi:solute carrier family 30 (zinc transporter), member 2